MTCVTNKGWDGWTALEKVAMAPDAAGSGADHPQEVNDVTISPAEVRVSSRDLDNKTGERNGFIGRCRRQLRSQLSRAEKPLSVSLGMIQEGFGH